ncbi:MAG TPA: amidase [Bryobacteraceae bacterium]|jgi:aspartyl-tRNA(Asn)/glutamyl-tRNA(Gln) amidotransferase subunit A|nr:amidase [Bryobacteraceae bacterium]
MNTGLTRRTLLAGTAAASVLNALPASNTDPADWTLLEASAALSKRRISSLELTECLLDRIRKIDPKLNAFITLTADQALAEARNYDEKRNAQGSPLRGIPIALKDNIDTAGLKTTAASRVFADRVPAQDADVTRRLKQAGIVLLGKLNLDEMAFEGTGTTSCFGPVHNPWSLSRITGGSSAGSAAAVSSGLCFASVGSDDGGSVRIPGAFCGVVGFKTTYGRVSTRGVVPSAYSLDTIGPITRTVEDAAVMLQVLAGFDPLDSITLNVPVPNYLEAIGQPISDLRVGIPRDYFFEQLHPDVATRIEEAVAVLEPKVKSTREVKLPRFQFVENGDYNVELYHYQKQFFDKTPELYHPWSREELDDVKNVQTVPYIETLKRIRECRRDIRLIFEDVDVLLLPTMREPAPLITETINRTHKRPPSNTSAFNRFGTPAMTVPCGLSRDGLPVGLQIVGPAFAEKRVLSVAYAYQQAVPFHRQFKPQFREA